MKKINTLLYMLLAGFVALFATGANAQTTWDFSTMSDADKTACQADADNWLLGADRWCYVGGALENAPLVANGTELDYAKGLTFTASAPSAKEEGKAKVRCNYGSSRLELNGTGVQMTINGLKAGQVVTVKCLTGKSETARGLDATNLSGTQGFGEAAISSEEMTCTGTVAADGSVTITTLVGGMYIYSVSVSDAQQGGGEPIDPDQPDVTDDHSVSLNTAVNQVRLTVGSEIKYYNTDDVKIAFNKAEGTVIVTPVAGDWVDTYTRSVSHIDFAVAQQQGGDSDIHEGEIKITEAKGWQESLYAKWEKYSGAASYNVYYKGGKAADWTKIDQQLVRDYGSYARADIVGLVAGNDYAIKVVAVDNDGNEVNGVEGIAENMTVVNYDRSGYAHFNRTEGVGAYNNDGSLKKDAVVLYITNDNFNTITCEINTGNKSGLEKRTGLGEILQAFEKGKETRPFAIRFIGQISDVDGGQLMGEAGSLQLKGKGADTEANVTFEGIGDDATWYGWGMTISKVSGVEIRNIATMLFADDGIQLKEGYRVWVHNNDIFYGSVGGDSDQAKGDGSLDTKDQGSFNTFSYNHFWDSGKCSLCGMKSEATDNYETYHHNWFDHADSRMPRVRTKTIHVYNNYYDGISKYGVGATSGSSIFVEGNYFRNTNKPMMISLQGSDIAGGDDGTFSGEDGGIIKSYNNVFAEKSSNFRYVTYQEDNVDFDAYEATSRNEQVPSGVKTKKGGTSYNNFDTNASIFYVDGYTIDAAADVPSIVTGFYGAGRLNHGDFTWTFDNSKDDADYGVNTALKSKIQNYKTSLVGIYGDENAESGEQGGEGGDEPVNPNPGGDEGEDNPDEPETPVVTEGDIYALFVGGKLQSNNAGIFTEGSSPAKADKSGTMTINGTAYSEGLKMNSSGELTVTPTEDMTMTLYFDKRDDYSDGEIGLAVNGEDIAGVATASGDGYIITVDVKAGTSYTITKGGSVETCLFYVALESKDGGETTNPDEGDEEEPVDPNPGEGEDENPDTPATGEIITCNFDGKAASNSMFVATKDGAEPSWTSKNGPVTVGGVTYTNGVKMESATNIAFSIDATMTLNIYFTKAEKDPADIEVDDVKIEGVANDNYFVATTSVEAGDHNITRGSKETQIYLIELVPAGK